MNQLKNQIAAIVTSLLLLSCATRQPASVGSPENAPDYPRIFAKAAQIVELNPEQKSRAPKNVSEADLVSLLVENPSKLDSPIQDLIAEVKLESSNRDFTKHTRLLPPAGQPGYSDLRYYVSHPYYKFGSLMKADNLVKAWSDFLASAQKQIVLNVFDFDLMEIAEVLAARAKAGVSVHVGVDGPNVVAVRPEVKAVVDFLRANGVTVSEVRGVGLNHQKIAAIDWEDSNTARVLFSSGNLTQSCLGPEGDLKGMEAKSKYSIPNANHVLTMKSWLAANLVVHELSKTLNSKRPLRGSEYPMSGAYQITGPGVAPDTLEAYPENSFIITFTPGGGYRDVNSNLLAYLVDKTSPNYAPIRLVQFAYSSKALSAALLRRAQKEFQEKNRVMDFESIGDTPFAMQEWSQFLAMSGMAREQIAGGRAKFEEDATSPWLAALGAPGLKKLQQKIRIAPEIYGTHRVRVAGKSLAITGKIHHKLMRVGDYAVVGTSFNFSQGAETNNEQILVFRSKEMANFVEGIHHWLYERSPRSVYGEASRRNANAGRGSEPDPSKDAEDAVAP